MALQFMSPPQSSLQELQLAIRLMNVKKQLLDVSVSMIASERRVSCSMREKFNKYASSSVHLLLRGPT